MLVFADAERLRDPRAALVQLRARLGAMVGHGVMQRRDDVAQRRDGVAQRRDCVVRGGDAQLRNGSVRGGDCVVRGGDARAWIERHAAIAALFIDAAEIVQGLLDDDFRRTGRDRPHALGSAALRLSVLLARALRSSFVGGEGSSLVGGEEALDPAMVDELLAMPLPECVHARALEGYAHYALYPETYFIAADRAQRVHTGPWSVIGIRSIGVSLAACVAAALNTSLTDVFSVRPVGHPFARTLELDPALAERILDGRDRRAYAIVDEGPGLSGSSFGSVSDWLEDRRASRIHFFPSHAGDIGPQGSARHRARWARCARHMADFDAIFGPHAPPSIRFANWFPALREPAAGTLGGADPSAHWQDLSGGAWRAHRFDRESDWPPCIAMRERRKFLVRPGGSDSASHSADAGSEGKAWLLRFAGLGHYGEAAMERARALTAAGLIPPATAFRHGFIASEWLARYIPLPAAASRGRQIDRAALLDAVARHLSFLSRTYPAPDAPGARPPQLLEMLVCNLREALGDELARDAHARWAAHLPELDAHHTPVRSDNKMHAWEWLIDPAGHILKTDALDHHAAHDLIGAQDIGWDMAAARVELDLSDTEYESLIRRMARETARTHPRIALAFYELAYVSFQWALHALERQSLPQAHPEHRRLDVACARYAAYAYRRVIRAQNSA
ncbi:hypothetical protein [Pendulispora albinea]|uniref:Aminoglycoside phosphotransferase domain-containing protein n=1 Tax=Pendulispora albinea TaxID=2741071 RepID=A0ABZ2LUJ6_9BACT